ncbi:hypothetical protein PGT21_034531 [Puccinia graminis f. sp. tritici]|uniref:Uncharacterized protein n=1 Tax=Puccinia graminis f. sp. tritici TaxID=56615 RepID=A0A5B0LRX4_PUCGR|nr:hypothetical protein PGT21_034531 [Puccinia graminis f. sp. tritici]KAA1081775.1 hypothetical protein PGTUg99_005331 [Puccinia graminis f. sp. tritici]
MSHSTSFAKRQSLGDRWDDEIPIVISPSQLSFQKAYEALCVIGLVFTSILLISHTWGRRGNKRHPIVIAFILIAMINYWNALLPWFFNFWAAEKSSSFDEDPLGNSVPTYLACRINAVLASYLQTVIPSFAAAFVGEALRITWQVSKITHSNTPSTLTDLTDHEFQSQNDSLDLESNTKFDVSSTVPKLEHKVYTKTSSISDGNTLPEIKDQSSSASILSANRNRSSMRIFSFNRDTNWKWPFFLCFVPTLCGLPQLLMIVITYLQKDKSWIFIDIVSCRVRSEAAVSLRVMTLLFVLALTALFSGLMITITVGIRRSASRYGRSNLDMAVLIPIGFLSAQSIAGCLVVSVIYFTSKDQYHTALDLFGVINPIASVFVLVDREFFTTWNGWIRSLISFLMTRHGLKFNNLNCNTNLSSTRPNQVSTQHRHHKKSKQAPDHGMWTPPKPSYNRSHRLISMSSIGDSDVETDENIRTRVSRQATVTRPSRFRSLRRLTLHNRSSGTAYRQTISSSRRRGFSVAKRLSYHSRDSAPPRKLRRKVFSADCPAYTERSPETLTTSNNICGHRFRPEKESGSESSRIEYFETFILQLDSELPEKNQCGNSNGSMPSAVPAASSQPTSGAGALNVENSAGLKQINRKASKSL